MGAPLQPQQPTTLQSPALKQAQTVLRQYQHNNLAQALGKSSAAYTLSTCSTMTCLVQRSLDKAQVMHSQYDSNLKCCQSTHRVSGLRSLLKAGLAHCADSVTTPFSANMQCQAGVCEKQVHTTTGAAPVVAPQMAVLLYYSAAIVGCQAETCQLNL